MTRSPRSDTGRAFAARPGAGRKPTGKALCSLTVRLSPEHIERLRELGQGNASAGVRRLLEDNRGLRALLMSPYQGEYAYVSEQAIDAALLDSEQTRQGAVHET